MKASVILSIFCILALSACSYGHGIRRVLTFESPVKDISCIAKSLSRQGLERPWGDDDGSYEIELEPGYTMSVGFSRARYRDGDNLRTSQNKISHFINFGSPPAKCSLVNKARKPMKTVEAIVLADCGWEPIDTEVNKRCTRF